MNIECYVDNVFIFFLAFEKIHVLLRFEEYVYACIDDFSTAEGGLAFSGSRAYRCLAKGH